VTYLPSSSAVQALTVRQQVNGGELTKTLLTDATGAYAFDDALAVRGSTETAALVLKASSLAMLAKARRIDHLHAHFGSDATTAAMLASRLTGIPFSFTAHAKDIYHTYVDAESDQRMRFAKIREASFVVTVSDFNRKHLVEIAGIGAAHKIRRLYNGIDLTRFLHTSGDRDPSTILSVGRLVEKKGLSHLIEACNLLRARGISVYCQIVGDGPLREQLAGEIARAGLQKEVLLLGSRPQEELVALMRTATICVLPCMITDSGDRDGLPTVLLEALASGLPSISTTVAGIPEIIEHDKTGLLVEPASPAQLAGAIATLLASPAKRESFARNGRRKAERDFDLVKNTQALRGYFAGSITNPLGGFCEDRLRVS
jgi:glycosyltransferase involved in cell wall biosynthesis